MWHLMVGYVPHVAVTSLLVWLFLRMDCDLTLWFYEKFGKSVNDMKGKVIWITGASSGIGESLAFLLAAVGAKLIISGRRADRLDEVKMRCLEINKHLTSDDILVIPFDISDVKSHQPLFEQVMGHFSRVDVLVNNAGRSQRAAFEEIELEVDREMFETNVFGLINLTRIVLKNWYDNEQGGHIVVTSSTAGLFGAPFSCTYNATKHALHGYFESLRNEGYSKGIRISMICPGPVFSEILSKAFTGKLDEKVFGTHSAANKRMATSRCAYLMAIAIANKVDEAWISIQPILALYYATQYFPSLTRSLFPRIFTKDRILKFREGNY